MPTTFPHVAPLIGAQPIRSKKFVVVAVGMVVVVVLLLLLLRLLGMIVVTHL